MNPFERITNEAFRVAREGNGGGDLTSRATPGARLTSVPRPAAKFANDNERKKP